MVERRDLPFESFRGERLSRFLDLGKQGTQRAVDELLEYLEEGDGEALWTGLLESGPAAGEAARKALSGEDEGAARTVRELYEASKRALRDAGTKEERLAALATLFLCMAAAAVHHDTWITSQSREDLEGVFLDLSMAAPEPWAALFARAIGR